MSTYNNTSWCSDIILEYNLRRWWLCDGKRNNCGHGVNTSPLKLGMVPSHSICLNDPMKGQGPRLGQLLHFGIWAKVLLVYLQRSEKLATQQQERWRGPAFPPCC